MKEVHKMLIKSLIKDDMNSRRIRKVDKKLRNYAFYNDLKFERGYDGRETKDCSFYNVYLKFADGEYIRVYHTGKEFKVQLWTKESFVYSGIPTFNPSGVPSI